MKVFVFGFGYAAMALSRLAQETSFKISGCVRSPEKAASLRRAGHDVFALTAADGQARLDTTITNCDALIQSAPPGETGDPLLAAASEQLEQTASLRCILYWSTLGVYGDHQGRWIDEDAALLARSPRTLRRVEAERHWQDLGQRSGKYVMIHRLAGIYGPGRSALEDVQDGTARRVHKQGQVFNRIHVDDIAGAALAALLHSKPPRIVNICDDVPAPSEEVVRYAAELLKRTPPQLEPYETAAMSEMARSFWQDCRRCRNQTLRDVLGYELKFPDYKTGLSDCARRLSGEP
jgi:nucleoside-diphosphate-sugar epimerase